MDLMDKLDKKQIREFFSKGWMTHDATWLYLCMQELGAEKANRINKEAVKSMAGIEIFRILKLMGRGKGPITAYEDLKEIIDTGYRLIQPEFMKMHYGFPGRNVMRGGFDECFAYEGMKRFGMIDSYQCGIIIRTRSWLEGLGVGYEMIPEVDGCLMHTYGKCDIEFRFYLD
jgi:hypothetical protein